jgi:hypothetical protein
MAKAGKTPQGELWQKMQIELAFNLAAITHVILEDVRKMTELLIRVSYRNGLAHGRTRRRTKPKA